MSIARPLPGISLRSAWRSSDPKISADAKAFWQKQNLLSPTEAERRVNEICAVAYSGEELVGIATAYPERLEPLRARFAFFRCRVLPLETRSEITRQLALLSRDQLERWSLENPGEEVLGMAAIIPASEFREERLQPLWEDGGLNLNLVGFGPEEVQIRVAWFKHARLGQAQRRVLH